jgi:hypothetical protein
LPVKKDVNPTIKVGFFFDFIKKYDYLFLKNNIMETVDDIINLADYYSTYDDGVIRTISIDKPEPDFNGNPYVKPIEIPKTFKDVVLKMYPEIQDVVSAGYRENVMYDPNTFDPIKKYLVGIDLYFDDKYGMKKSKNEYGTELTDYFKMTYSELDFVTFHVRSFIFPPEKTNEEKFFEVFGKLKDD